MRMLNRKAATSLGVALLCGAGLGMIVASNLEWTSTGLAVDKQEAAALEATNGINDPDLQATSKAYVQVAKKVMPTVVSVTSEKVVRVNPLSELFRDDWWHKRLPKGRGDAGEFRQEGLGSGVIISADGYILTNNHVIREAESIAVLVDKKEYKAEIIGMDPKTDLAVIRIEANNLPVAELGDSDRLEVGELVLAVGNPFSLQLAHSVTAGIVSGIGRRKVGVGEIDYEDFIQTDAAINPGNSGGALANLRGELVGINTAIVSNSWGGGNVGIGFAIPINLARQIMGQLIETGKVVRGWLGVYIQTVTPDIAQAMSLPSTDGALVGEVTPNSPAEVAGLKDGDFIIDIDGVPVRDNSHLMNLVAAYKPDSTVRVKFIREGQEKELSVKLGIRPDSADEEPAESRESNHLGIVVENLTRELADRYGLSAKSGVVIVEVDPGSQAEQEGLVAGDVILEMNRKPVATVFDFNRIISQTKANGVVLLRIARDGANFFIALKVRND